MYSDKIVGAVEKVFRELDQHISGTATLTGMKCENLCNVCCLNTGIEASPIEFIPLAAWLYQSGKVDEFLTRLDLAEQTGYCVLFSPDAWKNGEWACTNYEKRGLICRLFGYGYRLNREGLPELVTCRVFKEGSPEAVAKARQLGIHAPDEVPVFRNYSMQLYSIDANLAINQLPINQAIRKAIEQLYFDYASGMEHEAGE